MEQASLFEASERLSMRKRPDSQITQVRKKQMKLQRDPKIPIRSWKTATQDRIRAVPAAQKAEIEIDGGVLQFVETSQVSIIMISVWSKGTTASHEILAVGSAVSEPVCSVMRLDRSCAQ